MEPITRKETYLAYLNGDTSVTLPEPITREERYLYDLCVSGTSGGGGGGSGGAQADWNEMDQSSPAYIKNKPFEKSNFYIRYDGLPTETVYVMQDEALGQVPYYRIADATSETWKISDLHVTLFSYGESLEVNSYTSSNDKIDYLVVSIPATGLNDVNGGFVAYPGATIDGDAITPGVYFVSTDFVSQLGLNITAVELSWKNVKMLDPLYTGYKITRYEARFTSAYNGLLDRKIDETSDAIVLNFEHGYDKSGRASILLGEKHDFSNQTWFYADSSVVTGLTTYGGSRITAHDAEFELSIN